MTDDLIKRAEAAMEGTTEGSWDLAGKTGSDPSFFGGYMHKIKVNDAWLAFVSGWQADPVAEAEAAANARFIAAARSLVPELVERVKELEAANRAWAMQAIAAGGQAQEAYEAQLKAEATLKAYEALKRPMR